MNPQSTPRTKARSLIFGRTGTGKTRFGQLWPGALRFDSDDAGPLDATVPTITTKHTKEVLITLDKLQTENKLPNTIVIDTSTGFYRQLELDHPEDTYKNEINRIYRQFLNKLFEYSCHLVILAWEKPIYASIGEPIGYETEPGKPATYIVKPTDSIIRGYRPDVPQDTEHLVDFVIRLSGDDSNENLFARVYAKRGPNFKQGQWIKDLTPQMIMDAYPKPVAKPVNEPTVKPTPSTATTLTDAMLIVLGKRYNDLVASDLRIRGIRAYAKAKNLKISPEITDPERAQIYASLLTDIEKLETEKTGATSSKIGIPAHLR